ncbi:glycosyltransferase [Murimonas intestini]|uniref:Glycosyltransferase involved in cell wall biosynthesis n=1 Tax=Murimonas intestini TaxID=1337051 RepID=A0AB73T6P0_9FIRM|nr:glycosyltransferase [Murimonas intestini]MCR1839600.1 glycosyltransferase [Murimonas intestini]MCR1866443.1 glycosyltransferase [Murimonas intestini]MCR1882439.1 glycosyltransferase [Murimonas intestini]
MKKNILIVSHTMELGGVERSLLGLLGAIDYTKYKVDLFLFRQEGELLSLIPKGVNLLPEIPAYTVLARSMYQTLREGHVILTAARLLGKLAANSYAKKHHYVNSGVAIEYSHKYTRYFMPDIQKDIEYDFAISFLTPHYFVNEKVDAKHKIAWIHTDYLTVQVNIDSELKMWSAYDYIASISENVTKNFVKIFPSLEKKIILVENILPKSLVETQAKVLVPQAFESNILNLLSVGRFSTSKNFDSVPEICSRIINKGVKVKWFLIGYGGDEPLIRQKVKESGMQEYVIILGKKENPYPYIRSCDVYVQPSRYEGKCVAVREAQMLGKPVIITNYTTAPSQLEDGVDGMIVPMEIEKCAQAIVDILKNENLLHELSENCKQRDYSNAEEIEKIYEIMEESDIGMVRKKR